MFCLYELVYTLVNIVKGVMYLENSMCEGLYTSSYVGLLKVLTSQMAISLENIRHLHEQITIQSQKIRYVYNNICAFTNISRFRSEQLEWEQRKRADSAEKYREQLENFISILHF